MPIFRRVDSASIALNQFSQQVAHKFFIIDDENLRLIVNNGDAWLLNQGFNSLVIGDFLKADNGKADLEIGSGARF